ncbi:MAG: short-chain dehydrogenase [Zetaproteobacteria bacterium CG06_land_8_20_14_3_00_59_53]|nr:MAG: short-chain dehydrogenase [Zetaproteobacteria bacterium CG2_30_59_37]PIO90821.1 MAG: short-chain dehydrogenase [Zetaproteobacteria bacterium CG23_combo_of_CG06-09_8_20_14_all_59_86]PIQ64704.1 MAG: short-chain dehydrogenase [Zetaproteobacteria bacterium CG11_big_fil_rev_8_21_14_0_20_59_439]PIU71130.1 MAG: short-chain dehydrogenase [Zetaproteobacteria bacterium CG06_land_8_20_14_3_00_59_53]PIU96624.1 MAG: short-chain dehydrogenase [Zetaproteobacteria bacterium CG03_land_8_20_14_0_80_59_51
MTQGISAQSIIMVTGASSGLGRAVCVALGGKGASVVALGRNAEELAYTQNLVEQAGGRCLCIPFDLLEFDSYGKLFLGLKDQIPHLDGLIHCAGALKRCTPLQYVKADDFRGMLDIHLAAPNLLTQIMLPLIRRAEACTVVFTSCDMMRDNLPNWHGYGMAKRALVYASAMWQMEHPDKPYRFVTLNPGKVRTALFKRAYGGMHPSEVPGPADVTEGFLRLFIAPTDAVNGKSLQLDEALAL